MAGGLSAIVLCASCALRENQSGRMLLLWGMILLPFSVVGAAIYMIRRMSRAETAEEMNQELNP